MEKRRDLNEVLGLAIPERHILAVSEEGDIRGFGITLVGRTLSYFYHPASRSRIGTPPDSSPSLDVFAKKVYV
jgi:hypothetical protein